MLFWECLLPLPHLIIMLFFYLFFRYLMFKEDLNFSEWCTTGVVLFPDATLPLRVIQSNFVVAIERALTQVDAPYTIGVVCELLVTAGYLFCPQIEFPSLVFCCNFCP